MTKPAIYDQHDKAFAQVQAFVILKNDQRVATIAFKFPKDGAGRLYAYVHWIGTEMVRGHANGYGYDKKSAAVESAVNKLPRNKEDAGSDNLHLFIKCLFNIGGSNWDIKLRDAGFNVLQAV